MFRRVVVGSREVGRGFRLLLLVLEREGRLLEAPQLLHEAVVRIGSLPLRLHKLEGVLELH